MKKLALLIALVFGFIALSISQVPTIIPVSPITEHVIFQQGITVQGTFNHGLDLNDLDDVNAGSPSNGQVVTWDNGTSKWIASTVSASDEKVKIDAAATAGYLGAAYNDGVFRADQNELTYTDGGDFITLGLADHDTARTALGLAIGTDVQAYDADLTTYAGITPSANVQTLLGAADYAAFKTSLSLNNVENTALSIWAGTSNVTTVGTLIGPLAFIQNSDTVTFSHDGTDAYVGWNDGELYLRTIKTDAVGVVNIQGNGTGYAAMRVYDEDRAECVQVYGYSQEGHIEVAGISPGDLNFQADASVNAKFFASAASGDIPEVKVTGYRTGDASRTLEIGVGVDAADTASFDGVGHYKFDGELETVSQYGTMQTATGDGTTTIDWGLGNYMYFTFGAQNDTFTFTAPANKGKVTLILKQDGVGSRTATWPGTVKWPGGTAPTLSTGAADVDIITFFWDGTNWFGIFNGDFS